MNQTPDDSMDEFDTDVMDDSMLAESDDKAEDNRRSRASNPASRRRIEELMERKRLKMQLNDDFYDLDLPEDL